jgi:hypothetical protein
MRFILDENLDVTLAPVLQHAGHDVATVPSQGLSGRPDTEIYRICQAERRTLITMDLDYSNPLRFPVTGTSGIIILRPPRPLIALIRLMFGGLPNLLQKSDPTGRLWIVEPARLRIHEPPHED